jgi:phosphoserine aminotransferase
MMKTRVYNFGAGPAMLPEAILCEAQADLLNWQGLGMSVLEIGHRTTEFAALMDQAEANLRALLSIPDNYHVLFLGGAARTHFAMVPLNFLTNEQQGGYLVSGIWSQIAYAEACKLKSAVCIASSENNGFTNVPSFALKKPDKMAYLYYTPNETINGVRFESPPKIDGLPLIADMTSCLLSEPINIQDYALIFAGAQKNIAPAGLTVAIIQANFLKQEPTIPIPTMLDYRTHVKHRSLYATPPTFNCYLAVKMFEWIKQQGGVEALYQINRQKASMLYQYIDESTFYQCNIVQNARSLMNVCFSLSNQALEAEFINLAKKQGLCALQGHRFVGGIRASLYNAMPMAGVEALIAFMQAFSKEHAA